MANQNNLLLANFPSSRLNPFSYFLAFFLLFSAKVANKILVLNLPYEIGHPCELKPPYLYYHYQEGVSFITFIEKVKKLFHIKVFWQINKNLSSIPKNIDFVLNSDKFPRKTKKLIKFCRSYKKQIKLIYSLKNHQHASIIRPL